jgi:acetyl esterase/lipase
MTRPWKDPEIAGIRELLASRRPPAGAPVPSLEERRQGMEFLGKMAALPQGSSVESGQVGGRPAEWHRPASEVEGRTILYLHGGGYALGSPLSHRGLVSWLASAAGSSAVAQDYRLAPENPFPAAVDDALAAYRELLGKTEPGKICIAGDSAGGGLALATLLAARQAGLAQPGCAFVISPWTDLAQSGRAYREVATDPMISKAGLDEMSAAYLGGADAKTPLASPAYADYAGLAPILIHVGSEEQLLSDSFAVAEAAAFAGVHVSLEVWPEMIHVWHVFAAQLTAGRKAIDSAGRWIAERLG